MLTLKELKKIKESLEELEATAEKFDWGPSQHLAQERQKEALKLVRRAIKEVKPKTPYEIGKRLFKDGHGISAIWGAVEHDSDMEECQRGYDDALAKAKAREDLKEIKSKLGFSRVGRNNV